MIADHCAPLSVTRAIQNFPIGNISLHEHQRAVLDAYNREGLFTLHPQVWLDAFDMEQLVIAKRRTLVDRNNNILGWWGDRPDRESIQEAVKSFAIVHPWDLLRANEQFVGSNEDWKIEGDVHPAAVIEGNCKLGKGSRILPGVLIEGNVIIGENCKIGPNCYLRGNTSIGNSCHIGQSVEIKNCLILSGTNIGHLSYVGDSILGENVNFGAGTIVSNLRHDGANHTSMVHGELVDTGRRKFGTIVGDGVHTGINTSIYPGRKLWPNTSTLPAAVVRKDILS